MAAQRLRELLQAYGADPSRWPEPAAGQPDAGTLAEARALDAALDQLVPPPADPLLLERIIVDAAGWPQMAPLAPTQLPLRAGRRMWWPLTALVAAAMLGLVVGWSDALIEPAPPVAEEAILISLLEDLD